MKNEGTFVPQHYLFRKANFSESVLRGKMFALRKKAMFKDKYLRKFLGFIANGGYCIYRHPISTDCPALDVLKVAENSPM